MTFGTVSVNLGENLTIFAFKKQQLPKPLTEKGGDMKSGALKGNRFFILLLISTVLGFQLFCTPSHPEEESVLAAVEQFFKALENRDVDLARNILLPEGAAFSVREEAGEKTIRFRTHIEMINSLTSSTETMLERIWNPKVLIHKEIAVVWAKYDFFRDGKFSHCGVDAFNLIKTAQGWKISGIIYTVEKEGCDERPQ